jgi:hypothetical protein
LYYDFTNLPIGRMLQREVKENMEYTETEDDWVIDWETDEDSEGENAY